MPSSGKEKHVLQLSGAYLKDLNSVTFMIVYSLRNNYLKEYNKRQFDILLLMNKTIEKNKIVK